MPKHSKTYYNKYTKQNMSTKCVILFDECKFKGNWIEVCEEIAHIQKETDLEKVRSLYIPKKFDDKVYLHTQPNWKGKSDVFTKSEKCLSKDSFSFLLGKNFSVFKRLKVNSVNK